MFIKDDIVEGEMNRSELSDTYARDGVVCLPGALDAETLDAARELFDWSCANPTPSACQFYEEMESTFYQDLCHPGAALVYRELLEESNIADLVGEVWNDDEVWFLYEQVFLKQGKATRRTPWHQDAPYLSLEGDKLAVMWINFDRVSKDCTLEFVRGSHSGVLYDGSAFDSDDDTVPIYGKGLPRLPDIEAARNDWDIVSWAVEPGDIIIFHPATLHGGAPTKNGVKRRSLSLRFFGSDAVYATRPAPAPAPLVAGLHESLSAGARFRHPAFPQLRPTPAGFDRIPHVAEGHTAPLRQQMTTN
ncbi:MAG: phytanoyl-CoA dioxygenase family protein [Pseudomonadota bacterium]